MNTEKQKSIKKRIQTTFMRNFHHSDSRQFDFLRLLPKGNRYIMFVVAFLMAFSLPAFSNVALKTLQRDANNLMNGGTLQLPMSCEIDGTLLIKNKSNITIDGNNLTITQLKHNTTTIKITDCENVTIKNLVLIGDPGSYEPFKRTAAVGIYMQSCKGENQMYGIKFYDHGWAGFEGSNVLNITFNQCLFEAEKVAVKTGDAYNCGIGSYGTQCDNWEIKNCVFKKTAMGVMFYTGHDHLSIHDNTFQDIRGQHGMYLNASSYVNIYNNTFVNVRYIAIKLQMNNGYSESEREIYIHNNVCNVNPSRNRGQAGIAVGAAEPQGPAKGVFWKNVRIENNHVNRFDYGIAVGHVKDANIINNELIDSVYGVLAKSYSGSIRDNTITTTEWSGIYCEIMDGLNAIIEGNVIRDAVHINTGDVYRRCGIFLTGTGVVELENNQMYQDTGQHLYGLYQDSGVTFTRYHNNRLLSPIELKGKVLSQDDNN